MQLSPECVAIIKTLREAVDGLRYRDGELAKASDNKDLQDSRHQALNNALAIRSDFLSKFGTLTQSYASTVDRYYADSPRPRLFDFFPARRAIASEQIC